MGVFSVCRVLFSVIFFILSRKLLFFVFHYAYHTIDTLENGMEELLEETLSHLLFTRVDHLVDEHNPLPIIALWVVDKIGELIVSVVVYTGARIGLHVLENMRVNPLETIKESVVDPIKGFVLEKSRENEHVFKRYVVAPIGDFAVKNIIKYVLSPIQKYVLPPIRKFDDLPTVVAAALILAVGEYQHPPIRTPFAVVAPITVPSPVKIFALFLEKLLVLALISKSSILMFAKLAQIQFENLRNRTEVVRRLDVIAKATISKARIGLHVLENMRVILLETIKESAVDPIKGFVLEKSREYENVFKRYVVASIGEYAVKNIQKYVLPLIRIFLDLPPELVMMIFAVGEYQPPPTRTPFAVPAPIQEYVQKYVLAPIQEHVQKYVLAPFAVPPPILKYVLDVPAPIRKYVLNPFAVVAPITVPSPIKRFARFLIELLVLALIPKLRILMSAKLAQIQRRLRILHDIRMMKNFRYQFENLRNMTEVVRRLDVVAEANSKAIQPNARTWLTSVKQIIESSNLHGFEEVEKLYSERLEQNFPRF